MADERICIRCQKPITSDISYELVRVTKGRRLIIFPKNVYHIMPFHTKGEIKSWIEHGQQVSRSPEE